MTNATLIQATPKELAEMIAKEVARFAQSEPVWLTAPQLAARLGVSRQHIESLVHYGKIPFIDIATPGSTKRMLRFSLAAVERCMWSENPPIRTI